MYTNIHWYTNLDFQENIQVWNHIFLSSSDPSHRHYMGENLARWHADSTHTTLYLNAASRLIDSGVFGLWLCRSHSFLAKVKEKVLGKSSWVPMNVWDWCSQQMWVAVLSCLCRLAKRQHQECQLLETRWEDTASLLVQGMFSLKKALQEKATRQSPIM